MRDVTYGDQMKSTIRESLPLADWDKKSQSFRRERIILAHQILDGVPEANLDLSDYFRLQKLPKNLYIIACGAGWLSLHPAFQEMGLRRTDDGNVAVGGDEGPIALTKIFSRSPATLYMWSNSVFDHDLVQRCWSMFAIAGNGAWDPHLFSISPKPSDKDLLLLRLKYAYDHHCGR